MRVERPEAEYNEHANLLRRALLGRPETVVANVPYRRDRRGAGAGS